MYNELYQMIFKLYLSRHCFLADSAPIKKKELKTSPYGWGQEYDGLIPCRWVRPITEWHSGYGTTLHFVVRLILNLLRVPLHCSDVHLDPDWLYLLAPYLLEKNFEKYSIQYSCKLFVRRIVT